MTMSARNIFQGARMTGAILSFPIYAFVVLPWLILGSISANQCGMEKHLLPYLTYRCINIQKLHCYRLGMRGLQLFLQVSIIRVDLFR
jgi:hypothetical protein